MSNRLELQIKKTGSDLNNTKFIHPQKPVAPGRLASLRDNVTRFTSYTTPNGDTLAIPVSVEPVEANPLTRKRKKDDQQKQPVVGWSNLERSRKGNNISHFYLYYSIIRLFDYSIIRLFTDDFLFNKGPPTSLPAAKTRIVQARKQRIRRRPYYDDTDRSALRLMRRLRATWSSAEDSYLLMCKVLNEFQLFTWRIP